MNNNNLLNFPKYVLPKPILIAIKFPRLLFFIVFAQNTNWNIKLRYNLVILIQTTQIYYTKSCLNNLDY